MKTHKETRNIVRKWPIRLNAKVDQDRLAQLMNTLADTQQPTTVPAGRRLWRSIMQNPTTKVTVSVAALVAILLGVFLGTGSWDSSTVAWAEVVKTIDRVTAWRFRPLTPPRAGTGGFCSTPELKTRLFINNTLNSHTIFPRKYSR